MSEQQKPPVRSWDEVFPERFLKAEHLKGKRPVVEIAAFIRDDELEDGKGVLRFKPPAKKELALNSTNARCLRAMFGPDPQACVGKRIVLCEGRARNPQTGAMGPCVRIFGSPDITEPVSVAVPRKRGRPEVLTMQPTGKAQQQETEQPADREPGEE